MRIRLAACLFTLALSGAPAFAADEAPQWLRQAASAPSPSYDKEVPAVALLDESRVTVEEDGRVVTVTRGAVRILSREGRSAARAADSYRTDGTSKIREMNAWMIRPSGEVKKYGKDAVVELAIDNDVYNEVRTKVIAASDDAEVGAVFGYEVTTEERSVFTQFRWQFGVGRLPTLVSRFTVALPAGWRAESVTFNRPKLEPAVSGTTYAWELNGLPYIKEEPASPEVTNLAPRLAVSIFPPEGRQAGAGRSFASWADVSRWLSELQDPQAAVDEAISAKARALTAGAKTDLERVRAIGRYAQSVRYISIQMNIGRGGGYRPHAASEVFAKSYGDCKDKANLMRAMLKAVEIPSYLVGIYAGDPTYVREEWPSPTQFNHCIIAVGVGEEANAPSVVAHPTLGRLLIFDPTDENTPVGDLPEHEQGSFALVVAGERGALLKVPVVEPEANRLERESEVTLAADGSVLARVRERSNGQTAASERRAFRSAARPEYTKRIERWVNHGASGAAVTKVDAADEASGGRFDLEIEFAAPRYGQLMQGRLLVFKPAVLPHRHAIDLTEASRTNPLVLESQAFTETARVKLPEGFEVDEMPEPAKLETPFGSYSATYAVEGGQLVFRRSLVVRPVTVPPAQYPAVREFFGRIGGVEQSPVVLVRTH
jgi:hypothetical protein